MLVKIQYSEAYMKHLLSQRETFKFKSPWKHLIGYFNALLLSIYGLTKHASEV